MRNPIYGRTSLSKMGKAKSVSAGNGTVKFKFPYRTFYIADISSLQQIHAVVIPDGQPLRQASSRAFTQSTKAQYYGQRLVARYGLAVIGYWRRYYSGPIGRIRRIIDRFSPTKKIRLSML